MNAETAIVDLKLPHHSYQIHIGAGLLASLGALVRSVAPHERSGVIADGNVVETHGSEATRSLEAVGYQVTTKGLTPGEAGKQLDTVRELYALLINGRLERRSPVVAVGGGVVGDTAGFVAATYLRGVPFVQCPTTLLAMVDASVGGKVGVNLPQGKNLVGAFYQPSLVVADTDTLRTLPPRELRCGLAECVKHAVIRDEGLFSWLEQHLDEVFALETGALVELVQRNVQIKANVVMADEKESGQRAHLNFGHTFGHAIEATQAYGGYHHGEAVSLGMVAATRLAVQTGGCEAPVLGRLIALLERIGLPTVADSLVPTAKLYETMTLDKKVVDGRIRLVLPEGLGHVTVTAAPRAAINAAWDTLRN